MRKIIYLYNNFQLGVVAIVFIILILIGISYFSYSLVDFNANSIYDIRYYNVITTNYLKQLSNTIEIIIALFVVILSFMELYGNSVEFDTILVSMNNRKKVILAKIISYSIIVFLILTIIFLIISIIVMISFKDINILKKIVSIYYYLLFVSIITLLISLLLINLFRNYFANFLILAIVIIKKLFLEDSNSKYTSYLPIIKITTSIIHSYSLLDYLLVIFILLFLNIILYNNIDLKK